MKHQIINIYLFLLLHIFLCACNDNTKINDAPIWDCSKKVQTDSLDIQSLFSNTGITLLEETEKSRIGSIRKVMVKDSIIFVLDELLAKKIFTFNVHDGKFLNNVGRLGHSEKEYTSIHDFGVDTEKKLIYCLCDLDKVKIYDYEGNYISTHNLGIVAYRMAYHKGKFYFNCTEKGKGNLIIMNSNFTIIKQHFINEPDIPTLVLIEPIQIGWDGRIIYKRHLDNNIYILDENDEPHIYYSFDFGKNSISIEDVRGLGEQELKKMEDKHRGQIKCFAENGRYAFILFYDGTEPIVSIWDKNKNTKKLYPLSSIKDSKMSIFPGYIEYSYPTSFMTPIEAQNINKSIVTNKHIYSGDNPALYRLHQ